jgi:hypothetical protein
MPGVTLDLFGVSGAPGAFDASSVFQFSGLWIFAGTPGAADASSTPDILDASGVFSMPGAFGTHEILDALSPIRVRQALRIALLRGITRFHAHEDAVF